MAINKVRQVALDKLVPPGLIVTRSWLGQQGFTRHALDNQIKSGQLVSLAPGVYTRPHATLTWQNLVCSLPPTLNQDLYLGGLSALSVQGFSQYLSLSKHTVVHLYGKKTPPAWTKNVLPMVEPVWHSTKRLWTEGTDQTVAKYTIDFKWRNDLPSMRISSPERAYLELLMDVPGTISFEHADEIMQGLTQLSPRKLKELLLVCQSVKVKRLFFWMADRHRYAWRNKLNPEDFYLGAGKRAIAKTGKLDTTYLITVPEFMHG